jgi:hypothetical protein
MAHANADANPHSDTFPYPISLTLSRFDQFPRVATAVRIFLFLTRALPLCITSLLS